MIPDRHEQTLLRIATAVADDEALDWEQETSEDPDLHRRMQNIRLIQSISVAHRDVREEVLRTRPVESTGGSGGPMWGKLQILQRLGAGAFGEVYRAWDPDLECEVALKVPSPSATAAAEPGTRFLREARRLARVKHDNVVRVLGADTHGGRVGIWTELIEGRTLEDLLSHAGRFSADEAASIGMDLCRALAAVHRAGMVHRDVKTSNVLREEGGRIVLLDFSAAANRLPARDESQIRRPLSGTPRFMAPELFRGEPARVRSDLYSLGVLLYRLVTINYPVDASTLEELAEGQQHGRHTPLRDRRPDLSGPFVQVVERLLETDPARRYGSAGETEQALDAARTGRLTTLENVATTGGVDAQRPARRRMLRAWLSVAATVALATLIGFAFVGNPFAQPLQVETAFFATDSDDTTRQLRKLAPIRASDTVHLELSLTHDAHVYVLNRDEMGHHHPMFPRTDSTLANPLAADRRHRLPGDAQGWFMTEPGEVETIVVIASSFPLEQVETLIADMSAPGGATVDTEPGRTLRGLGGLREQPGALSDGSAVTQLSEELSELARTDDDLWVETYYFRSDVGTQVPR